MGDDINKCAFETVWGTETDSQTSSMSLRLVAGGGRKEGMVRVRDGCVPTVTFKMNNQQGPTG